jgi:hypothetical protein
VPVPQENSPVATDPLVQNRYRQAIESRRTTSVADCDSLPLLFNAAITAFEAQAWVGPVGGPAQNAYDWLIDHRAAGRRIVEDVLQTFDDAARKQPRMVAKTAWQSNWERMTP